MAISVDWSVTPWLVTIPKADVVLESGTKYKLTVDAFWSLLRDFSDSDEAIPRPTLYSRIPATASTPSITELNGTYYALQFEDGLYSVNIVDGNTNIRDVEIKNQVSVNTNNTTGFIDQSILTFGTFNSAVHWNATTGKSSITDTNTDGNEANPLKNIEDVLSQAVLKGFKTILLDESATLTGIANDFSEGYKFVGFSPVTVSLTVDPSVNVSNCEFIDLHLTGALDGVSVVRECITGAVTGVQGFVYKCSLGGLLTIAGNVNVEDCFLAAGLDSVAIDLDNKSNVVNMSGWAAGGVTFKNMVTNGVVCLAGEGGTLIIDAANTGGRVISAGGVAIDETYAANVDTISRKSIHDNVWASDKALTVDNFIGLS